MHLDQSVGNRKRALVRRSKTEYLVARITVAMPTCRSESDMISGRLSKPYIPVTLLGRLQTVHSVSAKSVVIVESEPMLDMAPGPI
jgi:hypothetical protein